MTPIEELLRQALEPTSSAPVAGDPLGTLDRRVRRARRRLAVGAGVVAAGIAAAVVIPLAVGGSGAPGRVTVATSPTPSASEQVLPPTASVLWPSTAVWVSTSAAGQRWMLYNDGQDSYVVRVTGKRATPIQVPRPADYVAAGRDVVWVVGGGDGGQSMSMLTAIDIRTHHVASINFPTTLLSFSAVVGNSLYVDATDSSGDFVERLDVRHGDIALMAKRAVPHAAELVATRTGNVWVHAANQLVKLEPTATGFDIPTRVPWGSGAIFAAVSGADGNSVWAYDGDRLIGLQPEALAGCVSCAEGYRVPVGGTPRAVVEADRGLYVALTDSSGSRAPGVYFFPRSSLGEGEPQPEASLSHVQVITMAADPGGGVDYVDDQGNLVHWQPVAR